MYSQYHSSKKELKKTAPIFTVTILLDNYN